MQLRWLIPSGAMKLETIKYADYEAEMPQSGQHIVCQERGENLIVYQAFNPDISRYAVEQQVFGGSHYKFTRMSWIKPNFLWMMYRAGWAGKHHQQRILAIEISKHNFLDILGQAIHSSYKEAIYENQLTWREQITQSDVRLQWDPDHDPYGGNLVRRAIQLGLRGDVLRNFATQWIVSIEDITPFVKEQKHLLDQGRIDELLVIKEKPLLIEDACIAARLELDGALMVDC